MEFRFRNFLILCTILSAVVGTWLISSLSVWLVNDDGIRKISFLLFAGTVLIAAVSLASWLFVALVQLWNHDSDGAIRSMRRRDSISDHLMSAYSTNDQNGSPSSVTYIPARMKPIEIVEKDELDADLASYIFEGDESNEHT